MIKAKKKRKRKKQMIYKGGIEHPLPFPTLIARTNSNQSCITISSRKEEEEKKKKKRKILPDKFYNSGVTHGSTVSPCSYPYVSETLTGHLPETQRTRRD